ncbi:portal protein [Escherichia coli]|nr:portal protein [Escherichia coli]
MMGASRKYLVYKSRPVSGRQMETKEVDAERMLHLKFVRPSAPDARDVFVVRCADPPQCPERV